MNKVGRSKTFLVIEDNANDAALIRSAFDALESCSAHVCRNVSEGKAYVLGAGMYQDRINYPFPNAAICDLKLEGESGLEFITWIKASAAFKKLPIFILSGSTSSRETAAAKRFGVTNVLTKPARFEDLKSMLGDLAAKLCS